MCRLKKNELETETVSKSIAETGKAKYPAYNTVRNAKTR